VPRSKPVANAAGDPGALAGTPGSAILPGAVPCCPRRRLALLPRPVPVGTVLTALARPGVEPGRRRRCHVPSTPSFRLAGQLPCVNSPGLRHPSLRRGGTGAPVLALHLRRLAAGGRTAPRPPHRRGSVAVADPPAQSRGGGGRPRPTADRERPTGNAAARIAGSAGTAHQEPRRRRVLSTDPRRNPSVTGPLEPTGPPPTRRRTGSRHPVLRLRPGPAHPRSTRSGTGGLACSLPPSSWWSWR